MSGPKRTERTEAGDQGLLDGMGARRVPREPIRRAELLPDGALFQADGSPAPEPHEPEPGLFDAPEAPDTPTAEHLQAALELVNDQSWRDPLPMPATMPERWRLYQLLAVRQLPHDDIAATAEYRRLMTEPTDDDLRACFVWDEGAGRWRFLDPAHWWVWPAGRLVIGARNADRRPPLPRTCPAQSCGCNAACGGPEHTCSTCRRPYWIELHGVAAGYCTYCYAEG